MSAREFEPRCFCEHDEPPGDWSHMLSALYRVRCNPFHGEKVRSFESDRAVVAAARATLATFIDESRLLD